jgi:hypothetical protein
MAGEDLAKRVTVVLRRFERLSEFAVKSEWALLKES